MNNRMRSLSQPSWLIVALAFIVGAIIGWILLGWVLFPVQYTNADPWDLNPAAKQTWVAMVVDSYSLNQDLALAQERLRGFDTQEVAPTLRQLVVMYNTKGDATSAARVQSFATAYGINLAAGAVPKPTATPGRTGTNILDNLGTLLIALALLLILAALGLFLYMRFRNRGAAQAPARQPKPATLSYQDAPVADATTPQMAPVAAAAVPVTAAAATQANRQTTAPRSVAPTAAKSLGTFAATYKFGDDNYDTSYTLETQRGEFLGECGMGISETLGEGKPDKVTAFDLWLFDKTDVRTVTEILMTEYAYNDQATRSRLATKGELLLAEKGKHVRLETATLVVDAEIVDLAYASTPGLPPNSHFQKLIVEMVPMQK